MSTRFGLYDFRRNRYALTFKAGDTLAAKRHVQFLLSQPSSVVAKHPRRFGLAMFVDLPADTSADLSFAADAAAFVVDVVDLVGRDAATIGYDVGPARPYLSRLDPARAHPQGEAVH